MTFWQWLTSNWVKVISTIGALNSALIGACASGMFTGLLPDSSIKLLAIFGFFMNVFLISVGFNNSAKEKVASVIETALNSTPPKQGGFARVWLLIGLAIASMLMVSACTTTPVAVLEKPCTVPSDYRIERCVKANAELYEVYQKRALDFVRNPNIPEEAKSVVRKAEALASPAVIEWLNATVAYMGIRDKVAAGETPEVQLLIATQNIDEFYRIADERIRALGLALSGKPVPGITSDQAVSAPATATVTVER